MKGRQSFTGAVCLELGKLGATLTDSIKIKILGQYLKIISVSKSCINHECNFSYYFLRLVFGGFTLPWHVPFFQAFFFSVGAGD